MILNKIAQVFDTETFFYIYFRGSNVIFVLVSQACGFKT